MSEKEEKKLTLKERMAMKKKKTENISVFKPVEKDLEEEKKKVSGCNKRGFDVLKLMIMRTLICLYPGC